MEESDRDKFTRLATARVNKAVKSIQLVGNLSNRSNYLYTEADVEKIFRVLNREIRSCRQRFEPRESSKSGFTLD
jgi:hypothetical protein